MDIKKIAEWSYRILAATLLQSLIATITFVSLHYSMITLEEIGSLNWQTKIGLIQASIGALYLQLVNIFYWIFDINLLDFKMIRKNKGDRDERRKNI